MPYPKVKISDNDGNAVGVSDNRLDVNVAGATMSTGDITIDSEFPAAATITDDFTNPSTTSVMSMLMGFEGSTWDRLTSTGSKLNICLHAADGTTLSETSNALDVNVASGSVTVNTISGFATSSNQSTIIGHVDGIDTLETTNNAIQTAVEGTLAVNTISGFATESTLSDIDTDTGNIAGAIGTHNDPAGATGMMLMGESRVVDTGAFPPVSGEGDSTNLQCSLYGVQFTNLVTETGAHSAVVNDDIAQIAAPAVVNVGGEYRASEDDYTDGDVTILHTDIKGNLMVAPPSGTEFQVDVVAISAQSDGTYIGDIKFGEALPAGTNAIGKLSANDGVDIGNVDIPNLLAREDTAHANAEYGVATMTVRNDVLGSSTTSQDEDYAILKTDEKGALYTTHGITGGADGVTTDDTSGTVLGGDVTCKKVDIQAQTDNTGVIAVGFTGVDATVATGTGILLNAGDIYSLEINNLNLMYIQSSVSGEGVRFTYFT